MVGQRMFRCMECNHEWPREMGIGHSLIGRPKECPKCKSKKLYGLEDMNPSDSVESGGSGRMRSGIGRGQSGGVGQTRRRGQSLASDMDE